ncbi:hypothetical protein DJ535_17215 [Citrobacter murliniae]|uniref:Steroid 5-alpha reductase C-terminal domain-containing protein n=1 Tax=Citrobacter murliniae TaxID=67829 RepID=A0ABY2PTV5_9ENTR|nr:MULTISPECIES: methyltransferase [Citrobacter freundii complex]KLV64425.1 hypothetical protein SK36_02459 [Citrobacter sp. MGH106]THE36015.1 hypothetical protein DJ535_17215 [Citrobacter murliniae]
MATLWMLLELVNLIVFTLFILPRPQPAGARPLLPIAATRLLRLTFLLPILAFGYSLFFDHQINPADWGYLAIAIIGNALVIKGKWDLGGSHTWTGYYLPNAKRVTRGIFAWIAHPMYTGIILVIISCSLVYITRLPIWLSVLALICCFYITGFLILAALRESRQLVQA